MVDVALIKETITELLGANVDKETIFSTLRDIGIDEQDIVKYYSELTEKKETPKIKAEKKIEEKIEEEEEEETEEEEEETEEEEEIIEKQIPIKLKVPEPQDSTEDLEKVTKDIIDTEQKIKEEEEVIEKQKKFSFTDLETDSIADLKIQITELENTISEIKAQINGLTKIMKDILSENRNILNKLK